MSIVIQNSLSTTSCKNHKNTVSQIMISIIMEFLKFLIINKKFWLMPIVIVLLIFGALIILGEGSVLSPFIYSLI